MSRSQGRTTLNTGRNGLKYARRKEMKEGWYLHNRQSNLTIALDQCDQIWRFIGLWATL